MHTTLTASETPQMSILSRRLITFGAFFAFFLFGFTDNLKGLTIPPLLKELGLTYGQGGVILFGAYIGFLVATLITGPLADAAGKKAVILFYCACLLVGMSGYSASSAYGLLIAAMTLIGFGLGCVEVGANLVIVDLYRDAKGQYLVMLAFFHGLGSMLAPLYSGQMLEAGRSWRNVYQYSLPLAAALLVFFLLVKYPRRQSSDSAAFDIHAIRKSALTKDMLLFYAAIALYVAAELGIASWSGEFLQNARKFSVTQSSTYLALFFAALTAGRFIGSFLVERIGYLKILTYAAASSVVCVAVGILGTPQTVIFIPLTGLFFSIIFPTIIAAVSDLHKENIGTILGVLFAFAGAGGALGPWMIGVCNDHFGLLAGFGVNIAFCALMTVMFLILLATAKHRKNG